jgi:hypothetical protein
LVSIDLDIEGTPRAIWLKLFAPSIRFRITSGVHRSAMISDARAIGQYWRYVPTNSVSRS